jgi:3-oxoacyl-[acyl-carrier protein] reductase
MSKYAFITGASRGIGSAIAKKLASKGYHLYLNCINNETLLHDLQKELIQQYGITCQCLIGDISDASFVEKCFTDISQLDVLINNAGIAHIGLCSEMKINEWQRIINTNLSAAFYTSKYAVPLMLRKHSGRIINISSVWGNVGASMEVAYSAAKGGLNSFTKALAKELAPSNIQVNAIACGVIDTEMNHCFDADEMNALRAEIPADRLGTPDEVADMVVALLSAPDYLTGQIITLDGGWL